MSILVARRSEHRLPNKLAARAGDTNELAKTFHGGGCLKRAMVAAPLAVILVGASVVGAQAATDPHLGSATSANTTLTGSTIESVSCSASTACTAVGSDLNTSGIDVTLAERWNRTGWRGRRRRTRPVTPLPRSRRAWSGCRARPPASAEAIRNFRRASSSRAWPRHGTGSQWTAQSFPVPVDSSGWRLIRSVVHLGPLLRGGRGYSDDDRAPNDAFAATWNGASWSLQSTVNPDPDDFQFEQFDRSPAPRRRSAWRRPGNSANPGETMAEQWNGGSWQLQNLPSSDSAATVNSVSCTSAKFCEAVGLGSAYGWNGSAWTTQTVLADAAAAACRACRARRGASARSVGEYNDSPNDVPVAARWNGSARTSQAMPNPAKSTFAHANAVSCVSASSCKAGGYFELDVTSNDSKAFTEGWNGDAWQLQPAVAPPRRHLTELNWISCPSASSAKRSASITTVRGTRTASRKRGMGRSGRFSRSPIRRTRMVRPMTMGSYSVSCVSTQFCEAVGAGSAVGLALMWNGTSWTLQSRPGTGIVDRRWCPAQPSFCLSADAFGNVDIWDGASWSASPAVTGLTYVGSISCLSGMFCEAVGVETAARWRRCGTDLVDRPDRGRAGQHWPQRRLVHHRQFVRGGRRGCR